MNVEAPACVSSAVCECCSQDCKTVSKPRKGNLSLLLSIVALAVSLAAFAMVSINQYTNWLLENISELGYSN